MIRLMVPDVGDDEIAAVVDVLRSGYLVQGEQVRRFEEAIARRVGVRETVAVSSGTAALHLSLVALGIGPGDQVAVPTYSWPATANVVVLVGAEPAFVDIERCSLGMDPAALEAALRANPRIRAVMPVHAFGGLADIEAIVSLARARDLPVIEDAACALGAAAGGTSAGAWGTLGCFSFHPRKIVTTGEGGVVTTNDSVIAERIRASRNHGQRPTAEGQVFAEAGFNLRLTEFQAALGLAQLTRLDSILRVRRELAATYDGLFTNSPVCPPSARGPDTHTYQSYVVQLPAGIDRGALLRRLREQGIEAAIGTHHIPLTPFYRDRWGLRPGDFPVTDDVAARTLTLPLHHALTRDSQEFVVSRLLAGLS